MTSISIGQNHRTKTTIGEGSSIAIQKGTDAVVVVDGVLVNVCGSITRYRESLHGSGSTERRALFVKAFEKYGTVKVS